MRSEAEREAFAFQGVKIFNKVPNKQKSETSTIFKFKGYFSTLIFNTFNIVKNFPKYIVVNYIS